MASPLFVVLAMVALTLIQAIAGALGQQLAKLFPKSARRIHTCRCCCRKKHAEDMADDTKTTPSPPAVADAQRVPEPEPEAMLPFSTPPLSQQEARQCCCTCPSWADISRDLRNFLRRVSRAVLIYLMIGCETIHEFVLTFAMFGAITSNNCWCFQTSSWLRTLSSPYPAPQRSMAGVLSAWLESRRAATKHSSMLNHPARVHRRFINAGAATDIQCSWCRQDADSDRILSYRSLATWAIVFCKRPAT